MGKLELEVKVLDIDEKKFRKKLENLGAEFKNEFFQILYTYDLPTIYGRYVDLLLQINNPESDIKYETTVEKLKLLFFEIDNLLDLENKKKLEKITKCDCLLDVLNKDNYIEILNNEKLIEFIKSFHNNSNKWIRVRKSKDKTTIAVKHILAKKESSSIQQMLENEIEVPDIDAANKLLEALGYSYKSYQEKRRVTYILNNHEIDIDTWPDIPTFFEVEGENEEDLKEILQILGYKIENTVSCTADEVYRKYGKSMFEKRELKF